MIEFPRPLIGLSAYSGTGKTTLLKQLIPLLARKNLRIGVVKHAHHNFDIDHPGKDSYEARAAGAIQVAVTSKKRIAWIKEFNDNRDEPRLADALSVLYIDNLDLVIIEGFKNEDFPKIELHRPSLGHQLLCTDDENIVAIATDEPVAGLPAIPQLDLNNAAEIADFIADFIGSRSTDQSLHAVKP